MDGASQCRRSCDKMSTGHLGAALPSSCSHGGPFPERSLGFRLLAQRDLHRQILVGDLLCVLGPDLGSVASRSSTVCGLGGGRALEYARLVGGEWLSLSRLSCTWIPRDVKFPPDGLPLGKMHLCSCPFYF